MPQNTSAALGALEVPRPAALAAPRVRQVAAKPDSAGTPPFYARPSDDKSAAAAGGRLRTVDLYFVNMG